MIFKAATRFSFVSQLPGEITPTYVDCYKLGKVFYFGCITLILSSLVYGL